MKLGKIIVVMATVVSLNCNVSHAQSSMIHDKLEQEHEDIALLLKCVEAEAGNQDLYGKQLVTDVILNRVDSERFPDDIKAVITQKYHFSTYWDGSIETSDPSDETIEAVITELNERQDDEILFFSAGDYSIYCRPAYKYGDHYFGY